MAGDLHRIHDAGTITNRRYSDEEVATIFAKAIEAEDPALVQFFAGRFREQPAKVRVLINPAII